MRPAGDLDSVEYAYDNPVAGPGALLGVDSSWWDWETADLSQQGAQPSDDDWPFENGLSEDSTLDNSIF